MTTKQTLSHTKTDCYTEICPRTNIMLEIKFGKFGHNTMKIDKPYKKKPQKLKGLITHYLILLRAVRLFN